MMGLFRSKKGAHTSDVVKTSPTDFEITPPNELVLEDKPIVKRSYQPTHRTFAAADKNRLTNDWQKNNTRINEDIKNSLQLVRIRARDLCLNNDLAKKYLKIWQTNLIGPKGFQLRPEPRDPDGEIDKEAAKIISKAWKKFCHKRNFCVTGDISFYKFQCTYTQQFPRDGEFVIRKVYNYDNEFGFAFQFLDPDYLDETYNEILPNGNIVRLGIEFDNWGKPQRYHFRKNLKRAHSLYESINLQESRFSVPASHIIHSYDKDEANQVRGYPKLQQSLKRLNMMFAYEEAELIAARIGASKMGFFTENGEGEYTGDDIDENGDLITEVEPGIFEKLPRGVGIQAFDPQHPNGNYGAFMKDHRRNLASGMDVQYNQLANDLEGVNFSTLKTGFMDDRDRWRSAQTTFGEDVASPMFEAWLEVGLLNGSIPLPPAKIDKFLEHTWKCRVYPWMEPLKDAQTKKIMVDEGWISREDVIEEISSDDVLSVFSRHENELKLAKEKGIKLGGGNGSTTQKTE